MKPSLTLLATLLLAPMAVLHAADFKAGDLVRSGFPELPDTLYSMASGQKTVPEMTIRFPSNYSKDREFPLFIWLWGGHGGDGSGAGAGPIIAEEKDFIFVGMPLFKKEVIKTEPFNGLAINPKRDAEVIIKAYGTMMRKLYAAIPNIDTSRNTIGGSSNGAHTIATIFESGDANLMERLHNLVFAEGGFWLRRVENLKGRRLLLMQGNQGGEIRAAIIRDADALMQRAREQQIDATKVVMENFGHDLPPGFMPKIKDWLYSPEAQSTSKSAEAPGAGRPPTPQSAATNTEPAAKKK